MQGVLNEQQIENLPIDGRNFLDLAQLEPGMQRHPTQSVLPSITATLFLPELAT